MLILLLCAICIALGVLDLVPCHGLVTSHRIACYIVCRSTTLAGHTWTTLREYTSGSTIELTSRWGDVYTHTVDKMPTDRCDRSADRLLTRQLTDRLTDCWQTDRKLVIESGSAYDRLPVRTSMRGSSQPNFRNFPRIPLPQVVLAGSERTVVAGAYMRGLGGVRWLSPELLTLPHLEEYSLEHAALYRSRDHPEGDRIGLMDK